MSARRVARTRRALAVFTASTATLAGVAALGAAPAQAQITTCPVLGIQVASTLPPAAVGQPYSYTPSHTGASTPDCPATWSILSGSLPPGLMLDPTTGAITGDAGSRVSTSIFRLAVSNDTSLSAAYVALAVTDTIQLVPNPTTTTGFLTNVTTDGTHVYVAGPGTNAVYKLSNANPPLVQTPPVLPNLDFPVNVATAAGAVFATNYLGTNSVSYGTPPGNVVAPGCTTPTGIAASRDADNQIVAVGCTGSGEVLTFLAGTSTITSSTTLPGTNPSPSGIVWISGKYFLIGDTRNGVLYLIQFSGKTPALRATLTLPKGAKPANIAFDTVSNIAYVADAGLNEVSQVSVKTGAGSALADLGEFPVGSQPFGVAVNHASKTIVVTNSGDGTADVLTYTGTTVTVQYTPAVGTLPDGVAIIGADAYIANEVGGTVTVIDPPAGPGLGIKLKLRHGNHGQPAHAGSARFSSDPLVAPLPATAPGQENVR